MNISNLSSCIIKYSIIMNIHLHMPSLENSHMVDGKYLYYHYNQQQFNDKGWGCAYRSLQTLCSFFIFNHYYNIHIPTIPEVMIMINDE